MTEQVIGTILNVQNNLVNVMENIQTNLANTMLNVEENLLVTINNNNKTLNFDIINLFPPNSFEEISLKNISDKVRRNTSGTLNLNIVTSSDAPGSISKLLDDSNNVLGLALFVGFNKFIDSLVTEPADLLAGLMAGGGNNYKYHDSLFLLWIQENLHEYENLFKNVGSTKNLTTFPFLNIPEALGVFIEKWNSLQELQDLTARKPFRATGDAKVQTAYANLNIKTYTGPDGGTPQGISKLLADGTLSGAEWANAYTENIYGFFEYAKFYYPNGIHQMHNICNVVFNENLLNQLSEVQRQILKEAMISELVNKKVYIDPLSSTMNEVAATKGVEMVELPSDFYSGMLNEADIHYSNLENNGTSEERRILLSLKLYSTSHRHNLISMTPETI